MKKFEIGQTYHMRSACMHDCIWSYTVTKRTAQTITITDGKETKTCRVSKAATQYRNAETIYPWASIPWPPASAQTASAKPSTQGRATGPPPERSKK